MSAMSESLRRSILSPAINVARLQGLHGETHMAGIPREAIVDFLNSLTAEAGRGSVGKVSCSACESALEYRMATFFYEGQTWEIPLPISGKCRPIVRVVPGEA